MYSLYTYKENRLRQRNNVQSLTLTSCFYKKKLSKNSIRIFLFSRQIYSYDFHILKLNNLKIIYDLYF